jgi:hypothetical protein
MVPGSGSRPSAMRSFAKPRAWTNANSNPTASCGESSAKIASRSSSEGVAGTSPNQSASRRAAFTLAGSCERR